MQVIPCEIKTLVILISNEIPDENTDQNMTVSIQADFFLFIKFYYLQIVENNNHTSIKLEGRRPL